MAAQIIDGKAVSQAVRDEVRDGVTELRENGDPIPGLATILVGEDPASAIYVSNKQKACAEVGFESFDYRLDDDTTQAEVAKLIDSLNSEQQVSGILLQLPVPDHLDGDALTARIDPSKDVDGLTAVSIGRLALGKSGLRPCTPSGVMELLKRYEVPLEGAEAVIVGRSHLVGKPMVQLLLEENATVTVCHSRTRDLADVCKRADVLIAAVGQAQLVTADFVKPGAVIIDVGMNRLENGLVGDVEYDAVVDIASAITPVPGGVGPMTIACLLRNTLTAAKMQALG